MPLFDIRKIRAIEYPSTELTGIVETDAGKINNPVIAAIIANSGASILGAIIIRGRWRIVKPGMWVVIYPTGEIDLLSRYELSLLVDLPPLTDGDFLMINDNDFLLINDNDKVLI